MREFIIMSKWLNLPPESGHHPRNRPPTLGTTSVDFYHYPVMVWETSWRKTQMYCDEKSWRFFCLLRIIQESGVYQLGVPQGQVDSSAPSTTDPLICSFCLVTTPNTRSKTVEQSIVTWMFAREFITNNRHPGEPQLTNIGGTPHQPEYLF